MCCEWDQGDVTQLVHYAHLPHLVDSLPLPPLRLYRSYLTSFSLQSLVAYSSLPCWALTPPISAAAHMRKGSNSCMPIIE
jgi:hypothetical protein